MSAKSGNLMKCCNGYGIVAGLAVWLATVNATNAQGALNFTNSAGGFVLGLGCGGGVDDNSWLADLYYGPVGAPECLLTALHQPAGLRLGTIKGGISIIPGYAAGTTIVAQVRVWKFPDGVWWDDAVLFTSPLANIAVSPLFQVTLGDSAAMAPSLPHLTDYCLRPNDPPTHWPPQFEARVVLTNTLLFFWEGKANYRLQQNSTLNPTNWVTLTNVPWTDWYTGQLTVLKPSTPMFYRLLVLGP
jgi:hypothetical protein